MRHVDDDYAWARELRRHRLLFPDDRLVALTRRRYPSVDPPGSMSALDVGFGSGRNMRLLMELGFVTSGIELIDEAVTAASTTFADSPLLADVAVADIAEPPFADESFDIIVAWGVMFLRPLDEMKRDLKVVRDLLRPGGSLIVNFRRPESWFSQLGVQHGATITLDERALDYAGCVYTFLTTAEAVDLLGRTGFRIADQEEMELVQGPQRRRHSWSMFRAERR